MNRWILSAVFVGIFVLAIGCGPKEEPQPDPVLNVMGAKVKLVNEGAVKNCKFLGQVSAIYSGDAATLKLKEYHCKIDLRNKAAARGATHLVLNPPLMDPDFQIIGNAYNCR